MADSVVIAVAPSITAGHYSEFYDDIVAFLGRLIEASHPDDLVLIVADEKTKERMGGATPDGNLLAGSIADIWVRDFAPVRTTAGLFKFRYLPSYHRRKDALFIEHGFMLWFRSAGLEAKQVDLILDGGNFVYNGRDCAVVTERVLEDNPANTRAEIQHQIQTGLQLEHLAIIPEGPREKTGHADGMVVWLSEELLGVARYEEPIRSGVLAALERTLPGVEWVELPFEPTGETWQGWESAGGVYVNALSTENALYVPRFGLATDDLAVHAYQASASKTVIPVETGREVRLGGSIRCLTWELTGADAQRLQENTGRT
jgi:agmatine deiminase